MNFYSETPQILSIRVFWSLKLSTLKCNTKVLWTCIYQLYFVLKCTNKYYALLCFFTLKYSIKI